LAYSKALTLYDFTTTTTSKNVFYVDSFLKKIFKCFTLDDKNYRYLQQKSVRGKKVEINCLAREFLHIILFDFLRIRSVHCGFGTLLSVSLDPKVGEQNEEQETVQRYDILEHFRKDAIVKDYDVNHVTEYYHKLRHLEGGEVLLPPEVLLVLRSEGRDRVVRVHDHVDE